MLESARPNGYGHQIEAPARSAHRPSRRARRMAAAQSTKEEDP